jgi:hypothetical protein
MHRTDAARHQSVVLRHAPAAAEAAPARSHVVVRLPAPKQEAPLSTLRSHTFPTRNTGQWCVAAVINNTTNHNNNNTVQHTPRHTTHAQAFGKVQYNCASHNN